ncbi:MAG: polysaccharide deacetylase [Conexibacter sp.]|nr:polysaccharide deacetylase [Conexibacter sp.]
MRRPRSSTTLPVVIAVVVAAAGIAASAPAASPYDLVLNNGGASTVPAAAPAGGATTDGAGGAAPGAAPSTGAASTTPTTTTPPATPAVPRIAPLRLHAATLRQDGHALVFDLSTRDPWTAASLLRGKRSLCVRLVYDDGGFQSRDVCASRRGAGMTIARVLQSGRHGPLHTLDGARTSRPTRRSLLARLDPHTIGLPYAPVHWRALSTTDGCIVSERASCYEALPQASAIIDLHAPQPIGCTATGPSYVTNGSRTKKVVALTFDDGPSIYTSRYLDVLEGAKIPAATFFMIGEQVAGNGALLKRELADGYELGDHTWSHPNVAGGGAFAAGQITSTANAIQTASGFRPCLFRAPGGAVSGSLTSGARALGFTTIEWDVDPQDWARPGTDAIYSRIMSQVRPGSIILMHDGGGPREQTLAALPRVIASLKARGYGFVTVGQMIGSQLRYG